MCRYVMDDKIDYDEIRKNVKYKYDNSVDELILDHIRREDVKWLMKQPDSKECDESIKFIDKSYLYQMKKYNRRFRNYEKEYLKFWRNENQRKYNIAVKKYKKGLKDEKKAKIKE